MYILIMAVDVKLGTVTVGRMQMRFAFLVVVIFTIATVIMEAYDMMGSSTIMRDTTVGIMNAREVITPQDNIYQQ